MAEENKDIVEGLSKVTAKLSTTNQTLDDVKDKIIEGSREEAEQFNNLFNAQAQAESFNKNFEQMNANTQRTALNKIISDNEKFAEANLKLAEKEKSEKLQVLIDRTQNKHIIKNSSLGGKTNLHGQRLVYPIKKHSHIRHVYNHLSKGKEHLMEAMMHKGKGKLFTSAVESVVKGVKTGIRKRGSKLRSRTLIL